MDPNPCKTERVGPRSSTFQESLRTLECYSRSRQHPKPLLCEKSKPASMDYTCFKGTKLLWRSSRDPGAEETLESRKTELVHSCANLLGNSRQVESWGVKKHNAGLISAHIKLQAPKLHLNLVLNYGSLSGPALLLPGLDGDIL